MHRWKPNLNSPVPLHRQISAYMLERISSGDWPPGTQIAPQRELCRLFGVNRSTVVTALGQLSALGLIEGRRGGGTRVSPAAAGQSGGWHSYLEEGSHYPNLPAVQAINRLEFEPGLIRLGTGELAPGLLPEQTMMQILGELSCQPQLPLSYEEPLGSLRLRKALSSQLASSGIQADPSSILITSGALQGLQLIAVGLLPRGSTILLEKPSYLYSIHSFQSAGVKFCGLPMDEEGMLISAISAEAARTRAAMLYSIPGFHNPTGVLMSAQRRLEVMETTAALDLPILEDGAYQELWLDSPPLPPLKALDQEGRVLHLGTLSKSVSPGLRLGWVVGPAPVIDRLADIKMQSDYGSSTLSQLVAARWLEGGYHEAHLTKLRGELRSRRAALLELLQVHFAGLAAWNIPAGGFYVWLSLHTPLPPHRLFKAALQAGVLLNTGDLYDRSDGRHLRLSYAYASLPELKAGIVALANIIRHWSNDK
ncbi:PLP-dependent aminotransferase family protein [Paenibacillus donghaensis]|uniref:GntR family transcriptional regulator n=1 Tax=Paenibacillus donghaensis TaxID=414771 RepID=A0A2Z2KSJ4_9BACL|nr:PLP-dependent aminotransferase family protein [Paenibacillus donghaensis]ASA24562.1 GntR family transcriptional regulator [Paenibacillus donghaensis]